MKIHILIALSLSFLSLLLSVEHARANVGIFAGYGHSIELIKSEAIRMVSEDVTILPGRGAFHFDGGIDGMDRVDYRCTFHLKNLTRDTVRIRVGFPLNAESVIYSDSGGWKTSELISYYRFIAQEEGHIYNVQYVPRNADGTLNHLFLWDMAFAPDEEKELFVTYEMPISMTMAVTAKDRGIWEYEKDWYSMFETGLLEHFGYVTETGKSWAGPIGEARFNVYVKGFEEYLRHRPFIEEFDSAEAAETEVRFPVRHPLYFPIREPEKWEEDAEGFIRRTIRNYKAQENLLFQYYFLLYFPVTPGDAERLFAMLDAQNFTREDYEDLHDIFREYNGTETSNKRIRHFLNNQLWYEKNVERKIPEEVMKMIGKRAGRV